MKNSMLRIFSRYILILLTLSSQVVLGQIQWQPSGYNFEGNEMVSYQNGSRIVSETTVEVGNVVAFQSVPTADKGYTYFGLTDAVDISANSHIDFRAYCIYYGSGNSNSTQLRIYNSDNTYQTLLLGAGVPCVMSIERTDTEVKFYHNNEVVKVDTVLSSVPLRIALRHNSNPESRFASISMVDSNLNPIPIQWQASGYNFEGSEIVSYQNTSRIVSETTIAVGNSVEFQSIPTVDRGYTYFGLTDANDISSNAHIDYRGYCNNQTSNTVLGIHNKADNTTQTYSLGAGIPCIVNIERTDTEVKFYHNNEVVKVDTVLSSVPLRIALRHQSNPESRVQVSLSNLNETDIAISVSGDALGIPAMDFTKTVTVTNNGPNNATGVTIQLGHDGLSLSSSSPTKGSINGTSWSIGDLATGESASLVLSLQGSTGGDYTISASLDESSFPVDSNASNNSGSQNITLSAPPVVSSVESSGLTWLILSNFIEEGRTMSSTTSYARALSATLIEPGDKVIADITGVSDDRPMIGVTTKNQSEVEAHNDIGQGLYDFGAICRYRTSFYGDGFAYVEGQTSQWATVSFPLEANPVCHVVLERNQDGSVTLSYSDNSGNSQSRTYAFPTSTDLRLLLYNNVPGTIFYENLEYIPGGTISSTPQADISVEIIPPSEVLLDTNFSLQVKVTNNGPDTASNVAVLTEKGGFSQLSNARTQGTYDNVTQTWDVGDILADSTATLTLTLNAPTAGDYQFDVTGIYNPYDTNTNNNVSSFAVTVTPPPITEDITLIDAYFSNDYPMLGETITLFITARNNTSETKLFKGGIYVDYKWEYILELGEYLNLGYNESIINGIWDVYFLAHETKILELNLKVKEDAVFTNPVIVTVSNNFDGFYASYGNNNPDLADIQIPLNINETSTAMSEVALSVEAVTSNPMMHQPVDFKVTIHNDNSNGNYALAKDVEVTVTLPSKFNTFTSNDGGIVSGQTITWQLEDISSYGTSTKYFTATSYTGGAETVTVSATALGSNTIPVGSGETVATPVSATTSVAIAEATTSVTITSCIKIGTSACYQTPPVIESGEEFSIQYSITNTGDLALESPTLYIDYGTSSQSNLSVELMNSPIPSDYTHDINFGTWNMISLVPSHTKSITLRFKASNSIDEQKRLYLEANLFSNSTLISSNYDAVNVAGEEVLAPNIAISQTGFPQTKTEDESFTYSLTVSNSGTATADSVTVTNFIPTGCLLLSSYPDLSGATTWSIGNLSANVANFLTLTISCSSGTRELNPTVTFNGGTATLNPKPTVTVISPSPTTTTLTISRSEWQTSVGVGSSFNFNVIVTNTGSIDAAGVIVTIPSINGCTVSPQNLDLQTIDSGGNKSDTVTVNCTSVATTSSHAISTNSTSTYASVSDTKSITVTATSPQTTTLAISRSEWQNSIEVGGAFTFTVTVSNTGSIDAAGVIVTIPSINGCTVSPQNLDLGIIEAGLSKSNTVHVESCTSATSAQNHVISTNTTSIYASVSDIESITVTAPVTSTTTSLSAVLTPMPGEVYLNQPFVLKASITAGINDATGVILTITGTGYQFNTSSSKTFETILAGTTVVYYVELQALSNNPGLLTTTLQGNNLTSVANASAGVTVLQESTGGSDGTSYWVENTAINAVYYNDGNVGIGTDVPTNKLEVNGTIRTKEVKIENTNWPWPDYVFDDGYNLIDLGLLKQQIETLGHLPDVPSASNVDKEGFSVNEMVVVLLKKIEELTLYTINQEETIRAIVGSHKQYGTVEGSSASKSESQQENVSLQTNVLVQNDNSATHKARVAETTLPQSNLSTQTEDYWERSGAGNLYRGIKVGIGTNQPSHALEVNGVIRAKALQVRNQDWTNWPDYVFEDNYKLTDLIALKEQIQALGHLPNLPSSSEVASNGYKLSKIIPNLLEEVEKLTLYVIEQDNVLKQLKASLSTRLDLKPLPPKTISLDNLQKYRIEKN